MTRLDPASGTEGTVSGYCPICNMENCHIPNVPDAYDWMTQRALRHIEAEISAGPGRRE
jgi:hypothetical protein